jgi:hypothetical protein
MKTESSRKNQINEGVARVHVNKDKVQLESR